LQKLAKECANWKHFAIGYDRKAFEAYLGGRPFINPGKGDVSPVGSSPELKTPGAVGQDDGEKTPSKDSVTRVTKGGTEVEHERLDAVP
jgi:hypothetical protein